MYKLRGRVIVISFTLLILIVALATYLVPKKNDNNNRFNRISAEEEKKSVRENEGLNIKSISKFDEVFPAGMMSDNKILGSRWEGGKGAWSLVSCNLKDGTIEQLMDDLGSSLIDLSPNGRWAAALELEAVGGELDPGETGNNLQYKIRIYNVETKEMTTLDNVEAISESKYIFHRFSWSHDSRYLIMYSDEKIARVLLYDLQENKVRRVDYPELKGVKKINDYSMSFDNNTLFFIGDSRLYSLDIRNPQSLNTVIHDSLSMYKVIDGDSILYMKSDYESETEDNQLFKYITSSGRTMKITEYPIGSVVAISDDGSRVAYRDAEGDGVLHALRIENDKVVEEVVLYKGDEAAMIGGAMYRFIWSSNNGKFLIGVSKAEIIGEQAAEEYSLVITLK